MSPWFVDYEVCEHTVSTVLFASQWPGPRSEVTLHADFVRGTKMVTRGLQEAKTCGESTVDLRLPDLTGTPLRGYPHIWKPTIVEDVVAGDDYRILPTLRIYRLDDLPMQRVEDGAFIVQTDDCDLGDSIAIRAAMQRAGLIDEDMRPSFLFRGFHDDEVGKRLGEWSLLPEKHRGNKLLLRDVGLLLWGHVPERASIEVTQDGALEIYGDVRALERLRERWAHDWPGGDGKLRYTPDEEGERRSHYPFLLKRHGPPSNQLVSFFYLLAEGPMNADPLTEFLAWVNAPRYQREDGRWDVSFPG